MIAVAWLALAAAAILLPSIVARARRNHHARQARTALVKANGWLDELIQSALEDEDSPIYDALVCEQIERAEGWIA